MDRRSELATEEELLIAINDNSNRNIFLGNGFNLCLGINTSYCSLFKGILSSNKIKEMIPADIQKNIENDNFNLEAHIKKIPEMYRGIVMERFYEVVLKRCKRRIFNKEVIGFLGKFNKFFTINYDPLLYRFLLKPRIDDSVQQSELYRNLEAIHNGRITGMEDFDDILLKARPKKSVYEIARQIFINAILEEVQGKEHSCIFDQGSEGKGDRTYETGA